VVAALVSQALQRHHQVLVVLEVMELQHQLAVLQLPMQAVVVAVAKVERLEQVVQVAVVLEASEALMQLLVQQTLVAVVGVAVTTEGTVPAVMAAQELLLLVTQALHNKHLVEL
jgi:hypothetical protein